MWGFQLIGKSVCPSLCFNDWDNRSAWWSGVSQNLAGGGHLMPEGNKAAKEGNPIYIFNSGTPILRLPYTGLLVQNQRESTRNRPASGAWTTRRNLEWYPTISCRFNVVPTSFMQRYFEDLPKPWLADRISGWLVSNGQRMAMVQVCSGYKN